MSRRTNEERIADLESRAAKLKADSERRLSVASDPICSLLWDAQAALNRVGVSTTDEKEREKCLDMALDCARLRIFRWDKIKEERNG